MNPIFSQNLFEATVSGDAPCGPDMEYSPAFNDFEELSKAREEHQIGSNIIPTQEPDWSNVFKTGCTLLEQSRDLRILTTVCRAALQQHGLPGLAQGLLLMAEWLENQWEYLHPELAIDDDYDPIFRSNAVAALSAPDGLIRSLRHAVFLETPIGTITVTVADRLLSGKTVEGQSVVSSTDQLSRILVEERDRNQERLSAISSIQNALVRVSSTFKEHLDSEYWPDIATLTEIIAKLGHFVVSNSEQQPSEGTQAAEPTTEVQSSLSPNHIAATVPAGLPQTLDSRNDAFKALALARKYFEENEPSHPAPLLIRRVERLSGMDFFSIIKDLTPEGLHQLQQLAGETADDSH